MKRLILIRHGITEGNKNRWYYGSTDLPLTEEGKEDLLSLRERGLYPGPLESSVYITTGLKRTEETLRIIYEKEPDKTITELKEMDFGIYECKCFDELSCDEEFLKWAYDETGDVKLKEGESRNQFSRRIAAGLEMLRAILREHHSVVAVCHGGVISAIMMKLFPEERGNVWDWMVEPGHGYEVVFEDVEPKEFRKLQQESHVNDKGFGKDR